MLVNEKEIISSKQLGILIFLDLILVSFWALTMVLDMVIGNMKTDTIEEAFTWVTNPSALFYLTYLNVTLLTFLGIVIFTGFFLYYYKNRTIWHWFALAVIPIYGLMNIFAYGSQITIIPYLTQFLDLSEYQSLAKFVIIMFIQAYPGTIVSIINLSAYGILVIPSVVFGWELFKESDKFRKIGGLLLILCAVPCVLSIVFLLLLNAELAGIFSVIGGFLPLAAYFDSSSLFSAKLRFSC
ncbi:MAG: hypothetical protein ACXACX_04485 [Candidatus Hodarchaeales archaeon]